MVTEGRLIKKVKSTAFSAFVTFSNIEVAKSIRSSQHSDGIHGSPIRCLMNQSTMVRLLSATSKKCHITKVFSILVQTIKNFCALCQNLAHSDISYLKQRATSSAIR